MILLRLLSGIISYIDFFTFLVTWSNWLLIYTTPDRRKIDYLIKLCSKQIALDMMAYPAVTFKFSIGNTRRHDAYACHLTDIDRNRIRYLYFPSISRLVEMNLKIIIY